MITLYGFGPAFGLADSSPFVMKAELLLKMAKLPYQLNHRGFKKAPKGKLPFIDDDGQIIADSTFIRWHLEKKYKIDFDALLTSEQRAHAWAIEKMLEDHTYWTMVHARWVIDSNFFKGPAHFFDSIPILLRGLIRKSIRNKMRKSLFGHGMGRHQQSEIEALGVQDIDALSAILGNKLYLFGETPCGVDATAGAFISAGLVPLFDTPIRARIEQHTNLVNYAKRIQDSYYTSVSTT